MKSVGWLRLENLRGRNIYIRPKGEHPLSLLDDLSFEALEQMKSEGFDPAVIVETSLGNFQAWLNHGEILPKEFSSKVARVLAQKFCADPSSADWRHFGRLAGLTNRKEKYQTAEGLFPFVKLIEAGGQIYPRAKEFLADMLRALQEAHRMADRHPIGMPARSPEQLQTIEDFRDKPCYQHDGNRVDLAFAIYALSHQVAEGEVRAAIASRDLSHKGSDKRQADYIDRTIAKAWKAVSYPTRER
jgi:hypothetical protein